MQKRKENQSYKKLRFKTKVSHIKFQGRSNEVKRLTGQIEIKGNKYNISVHHPIAFHEDVYAVQVAPDRKSWVKKYGFDEYWKAHYNDFTQVSASNNREALKKGIEELGLNK